MFEAAEGRGGLATVEVNTAYEPRERHFEVPGMPPIIRTIAKERDVARMVADVAAARERAEAVIVSWHSGVSLVSRDVVDYQRLMARTAIDAGADAVIGHHPHVLQPIEFYRGKPICYSIGNLFHALRSEHFTPESAVMELIFGWRRVSGVRVYPLWLDRGANPVPLRPAICAVGTSWRSWAISRRFDLTTAPGASSTRSHFSNANGDEDVREGGPHV